MQQRPGRSILTMLSIVIGVAAAVAVGLGTATTRNAYKQMFAMVTGRTTLEVDAPGGSGFDAELLDKVSAVPGVVAAAPLLDRGAKLNINDGEKQLKLEVLGIDPAVDNKVRDYDIAEGRQVEEGNELVLDEGFAKFVGINLGDEVKMLARVVPAPKFTVVGLSKPKSGAASLQMSMAFMPLDTAQMCFKQRGLIDKIQIVTAPKDDPDKIQPQIAELLHAVTLTAQRGDETVNVDVHLSGKAAERAAGGGELSGDVLLGVEAEDAADSGAKITNVVPDSPAEKAGLKVGDVITEIDGKKLVGYNALVERIKNRWGVSVHRPTASTQLMQETLMSTEQGLTLTTAFSILMAAFIILNTFLMNVSERRRQLSILRAIGAVKNQISWMLLGESILLGIAGTVIGLGLGVAIAFFATTLVGRVFDVQLPSLFEVMTPQPFIIGSFFGLAMAVIGAIVPALLAARVSPLEGMNRVTNVKKWDFTRYYLLFGPLLTIAGLALMYGSISGIVTIDAATYAAILLLIGLVLIDTVIFDPQAVFVASVLKLFSPVEASMALRQVLRNHMRSALTVAVLFIAGSTGVGMASSIQDCVQDVQDWFKKAIQADFVIRAMMPDMATGTAPDLPDELGQELEENKEKLHIYYEGMSFIQAKVPRGKDDSDALTVIAVAREYKDPKPPPFDLIEGKESELREDLLNGQVVIGSVLSMKTGFKVGDKLPLETKEGIQQLRVCGVANEYMVGGLAVHMARPYAEKWLGVEGHDGYIVRMREGFTSDQVKPGLAALAKKYDVLLMSQADIKQNVDQFEKGTVWSLWALVCMGFVVAAFGVVNTLTMNVLEQTRELGLLRIVAMTRKQVRRTIVMQALIIGLVGLPPGIFLGVGVAYVINLAMMPSFGHSVQFELHPWMLLSTLGAALAIVLVAAIIPARRATRINVVEALHYE
jgi:putative ABC transport system permease protein